MLLSHRLLKETGVTRFFQLGTLGTSFSLSYPPSNDIVVVNNIDISQHIAVLNEKCINYIQWSSFGLAIWEPTLNDYMKISFPRPWLPQLSSEEVAEDYLKAVNFLYPQTMSDFYLYFLNENGVFECIEVIHTHIRPTLAFHLMSLKKDGVSYSSVASFANHDAPYLYVLMARYSCHDYCSSKPIFVNDSFDVSKMKREIPIQLFREEMLKALTLEFPSHFFRTLQTLGLLERLVPELHANINCFQDPKWHEEDVYNHLLRSLDESRTFISSTKPLLKLAVLFHDIGKAATKADI
jgi:hypothetical protein